MKAFYVLLLLVLCSCSVKEDRAAGIEGVMDKYFQQKFQAWQ